MFPAGSVASISAICSRQSSSARAILEGWILRVIMIVIGPSLPAEAVAVEIIVAEGVVISRPD